MIESYESAKDVDVSRETSGTKLAVHIHRIKFLLIRYWWILAATMTIGLAVEGYLCSKLTPQYVSSSRMMVSGQINLNESTGYSEELANFFGTQAALMKSPDTITEAIARVSAMHPEVAMDTKATMEANQELKTSIFDLRVTSTNPEYAPLLLNAVMDSYLASKRSSKEQTTNRAVSSITSDITDLDSEIRNDEQQLLDFQKENNVIFIEQQANSTATYLVGLNNELARLLKEHDLLLLKSSKHADANNDVDSVDANTSADSGTSNNPSLTSSNASIQAEQEAIEKLKILREGYSTYLKDMHPKMIALSEAIDKEQKFLEVLKARQIQEEGAYQKNLELQIENLEKQIADWNKKSIDLSQRMGTYDLLKNKITRAQTLYDRLASSIQSINLNETVDQETVVIMERASIASLIPINYGLQLLYGALYGALAAAGILYLINRLNDKVYSPMMIEGMFEFPIVGQIPLVTRDKKSKRVPLLAENDPRYIFIESYRNIRSFILFHSTMKIRPKSLLISSSIPGEGKSTLASNLAITFAFSGARTLLIDADLRQGVLHKHFEVPLSPGLSDYLQQQISWREVVQGTHFPNLDVIPRGKTPYHAGELLLGTLVDLLLQESAAEYDMVLWDIVPILAADDASNLCSRMDGVLFVVRINHSSIQAVHSAMDILMQRGANIFGFVLNAVEPSQPGSYERYHYKKYYSTETQV